MLMSMGHGDVVIAARAQRQMGVFTRAEALDIGLTTAQVDWRVASGRWERVQPSVYRMAGAPLTWWGRLRAATVSPGRVVAGSHRSAAHALELGEVGRRDPLEITVLGYAPLELWGVRVHRTATLEGPDLVRRHGVALTSPARTVIDCAAGMTLSQRLALIDAAICSGRVNRRRLHDRAVALGSGRAGTGILRRATAPGAEAEFRSWLERQARVRIRQGGLPPPVWNVPVKRRGKLLAIIDAFWEQAPLGAEFDGLRFHLPPARRAHDVARDRRLLVEAGIPVMRYTYADVVQRPQEMVEQLGAALAARGS